MEPTIEITTKTARVALIALGEAYEGAKQDARRATGFEDYQKKHEARADAFNRAHSEIMKALGL